MMLPGKSEKAISQNELRMLRAGSEKRAVASM